MKEFEYKLSKEVLGQPSPYSGKVKIKVPKYVERNRMLREVNFKQNVGNEVDVNSNLESMDRLSEIVKEHVLKMEVKKGKTQFHSVEEIEYDMDANSFFTEVGMVIVRGIDLGNG